MVGLGLLCLSVSLAVVLVGQQLVSERERGCLCLDHDSPWTSLQQRLDDQISRLQEGPLSQISKCSGNQYSHRTG